MSRKLTQLHRLLNPENAFLLEMLWTQEAELHAGREVKISQTKLAAAADPAARALLICNQMKSIIYLTPPKSLTTLSYNLLLPPQGPILFPGDVLELHGPNSAPQVLTIPALDDNYFKFPSTFGGHQGESLQSFLNTHNQTLLQGMQSLSNRDNYTLLLCSPWKTKDEIPARIVLRAGNEQREQYLNYLLNSPEIRQQLNLLLRNYFPHPQDAKILESHRQRVQNFTSDYVATVYVEIVLSTRSPQPEQLSWSDYYRPRVVQTIENNLLSAPKYLRFYGLSAATVVHQLLTALPR